uniref:dATP/dGTP diphosphohydrolase N-terminal domain-containing protein n=1 Tax=viral metagenome TaxID=1070528 RepID=A0A6M3LI19_9ZZZZ
MLINDYIIKDSGERTEFQTGAVRDIQVDKGRFDLLPLLTIIDLAKHYQKGALKYSDRNWEKGIPISRFCDSAMRHLFQFILGLKDENHLIASIWNLVGAYETLKRIDEGVLPKELDDLPYILKDKK